MDLLVALLFLTVFQSNGAQEYNENYWTNYNYTPSGPYFDKSFSKNVTLLVGKTAYLRSRPLNAENRTISWIRYRDLHLLTVGLQTYTNDQRFQPVNIPELNEWTLQITYAQLKDSGIYMSQISTSPPTVHFVHLLVVQTHIEILGGPEMYISERDLLNLTCIVTNISRIPFHIKWTHNNNEIDYDSARGGISVMTEKREIIKSSLLIQNVMLADSGNYTCSPTELISEQIIVHVLRDNPSVAIRNKGQLKFIDLLLRYNLFVSIFLQMFTS